ncbi:MAG TPA: hypothetical protein VJ044_19275 [Candidatus Hodarchaeales archaeon]|nr:hypothetical protein [Candidatus Hodarchaeales archaeon]
MGKKTLGPMNFTEEQIKNHFITNPEWRSLFNKYYKDWTPLNYMQRAIKIFEKNGYRFVEKDRLKSEKFKHIFRPSLFKGDKFVVGLDFHHEDNAFEQLLICAVCDYDVDISTLK